VTQYILRRLIITVPILFGLTIITFTLTELMPGDFVDAMVPPEQKVALRPISSRRCGKPMVWTSLPRCVMCYG